MTIAAMRLQLDQAAQTIADLIADPEVQRTTTPEQKDRLLGYYESVTDAREFPPLLCPICGAIAGADGSCLDLLDSEPGVLKDQCLTGVFSSGPLACVTVDPTTAQEITCEDWWSNVSSMLANAAQLVRELGRPDQAEVLQSTSEGTATPIAESYKSREFQWPDWITDNKGWITFLVAAAIFVRLSGVDRR